MTCLYGPVCRLKGDPNTPPYQSCMAGYYRAAGLQVPARAKVKIIRPEKFFNRVRARVLRDTGELTAKVTIVGRGEPGVPVFVSSSNGLPDAEATVTPDSRGYWKARIRLVAGRDSVDGADVTAGYDESYAEEVTRAFDLIGPPRQPKKSLKEQPPQTESDVAIPTPGDKDCGDFTSQADAQRYFEANGGGPGLNVDRLDDDGDGIACDGR